MPETSAQTELDIDRQRRCDAMWTRFCRLMLDQGLSDAETLAGYDSLPKRIRAMRDAIACGPLRGFAPRTAVEAADLGLMQFRPEKPAAATEAWPGTIAKFRVLTQRLEHGEELFCERDRVLSMDDE
jgi:hypothetical protein